MRVATAKGDLVTVSFKSHLSTTVASAKGDLAVACLGGCYPTTTATAKWNLVAASVEGRCPAAAANAKGDLAVAYLRYCYPTASAQWNLVVEGHCRVAAYPKGRLAATTNCPKGRRDSADPTGRRLAGCPRGSLHRRLREYSLYAASWLL